MKFSSVAMLLFSLIILIFSFLLSEYKINVKIEESIKKNYENEISTIKSSLNKHSELINSIININNKTPSTNLEGSETANTGTSNENTSEFEYIKENGGITITKYTGKQTIVTIPNYIDQLPVKKIGENAFSETKVKSVTLPSGCKEIDWFAFYGCYALNTVYISNSVENIGYGTFEGCSKSLVIYCERNSFAEKYAQSFGINSSYFK